MSTLYVDTINEKTTGNGIIIPGHVIQVVTVSTQTQESTTSNTMVDSALTATITPKSSSNKIFVVASVQGLYNNTNNSAAAITIVRGSTDLAASGVNYGMSYIYASSGGGIVGGNTPCILDSPATTSATTYKVQYCRSAAIGTGTAYISVANTTSSLTLMEIAQ